MNQKMERKILSHRKNKKIFYLLFTCSLLFNSLFFDYKIFSKNNDVPTIEYLKSKPNFDYILGPGDVLKIYTEHSPKTMNLSAKTIDRFGTIDLPDLNRIYVEGLTIEELKTILNKSYEEFIKRPDFNVEISKYRSISVYIKGEIENPGLYQFEGSKTYLAGINSNDGFFTLFDLLRKAGGITDYSDLSNIEVTRVNSLSNGGGRIRANVNILDLFTSGDQRQNIRILDGDSFTVKRSEKKTITQFTDALKSNINPELVRVYVGGRVEKPGNIDIKKLSSLNEAIDMSGGIKSMKGKVRHVRYNSNGDVERQNFNYNSKAKRGSKNNPILKSGDIVFVTKGGLKATTEVLGDLTSPIQSLGNSFLLFRALSD